MPEHSAAALVGAQEALLQALATSVKDGALPVAGAALWAGHVLPGRRAGTTLDLRASSHRKLSKLLQARPVLPLQGASDCCLGVGSDAADLDATAAEALDPLQEGSVFEASASRFAKRRP